MGGTKSHRGWGHVRQLTNKSRRWQASYIGPDGLRHAAPTTFDTKTDAESWLGKERRLIVGEALGEAQWTAPKDRDIRRQRVSITLGEYGTKDIERREIKPLTRIEYTSLFTKHIAPPLGKLAINQITPEHIRAWYERTLTDRPKYRAHAFGLLKSILINAVKDGLIHFNPCDAVRTAKVRTTHSVKILDIDELAKVANEIEPQRFKALILISGWCALRYGEASELRRKDFNEDLSVLTISRGVTHRKDTDGNRCHISTPKSGKERIVAIPPHIREDIRIHLSNHVGPAQDAQLFPATYGCHLDDNTFRKALNRALKCVGKEGITPHSLRYFGASQVSRIASPIESRNYLGHADIAQTLHYSQLVSGRDQEIAVKMSELAGYQAISDPA